MPDPIKTNDEEFLAQVKMFHQVIALIPTEYGFTAAEGNFLANAMGTFEASLIDNDDKQVAARAARQKKDADRDLLEEIFRWMVRQFTSRPNVTNAKRVEAGLSARGEASTGKTPDFSQPPMLMVEQSGVHEHRIWFFMPTEDAKSTKKPANIDGAKLYVKIGGEASTNLKEYSLMTFYRKSPYKYPHEPEDAGKIAHYTGVWATDDDVQGTQSEVFSLVIT